MKVIETKIIPVSEIVVEEGFNVVRGSTIASLQVDDLVKSMAANGYLEIEPMAVSLVDGQYILRKGHRRLTAIPKANKIREKNDLEPITHVPVSVTEASRSEWLKEQIIGNMGLNPTPLGQARVYRELMNEAGLNQSEVAKEFGISAVQVSRYLKLLDAPEEVQKMIDDNKIAANTVINDILTKKDNEGKSVFGPRPKLTYSVNEETGEDEVDEASQKAVNKWEAKVTNKARRISEAQGGKKAGRAEKSKNDGPRIDPLNPDEAKAVAELVKKEFGNEWVDSLLQTNFLKIKFPAETQDES